MRPSTGRRALPDRQRVVALALAAASQSLNQLNQVILVVCNVLKENRNINGLKRFHHALFPRVICFRIVNGRKQGRTRLALYIPFQQFANLGLDCCVNTSGSALFATQIQLALCPVVQTQPLELGI